MEALHGDISSFLLRQRKGDRLADDPSDLPFLPQPSARLVQAHALPDFVAHASYHHVDVTAYGDVVEGLVVGDGRVDGLEDEEYVLREGLQVADVVEGGLVTHLTVVVGGEEMAVSLHPCRLHVDEELDELGEGDVMTAGQTDMGGVGAKLFHNVAPVGPPEHRVGREDLVYIGRQQSPVRLTNKGETDLVRFFLGRLADLGSLSTLGLMVILADLVQHAPQNSRPGGGGGLLYKTICLLMVPHKGGRH